VILETCSGTVQVDASTAIANQRSVPLSAGSSLVVEGTMSGGIFQAVTIANHMFACPPPPPANVPGAQMMPRGMQQ